MKIETPFGLIVVCVCMSCIMREAQRVLPTGQLASWTLAIYSLSQSSYIIATFISFAPVHLLQCMYTRTRARFDYCPHALLIAF
eukprot:COSAG01_NODE_140_length_24259_cov_41.225096_4_plen_84_part_00